MPPNGQRYTRSNAAKMQAWLSKHIDSKIINSSQHTAALLLWSAAVCRLSSLSLDAAEDNTQQPAVGADCERLAASVLQAVSSIGRLQAAGLLVQPVPGTVFAPALELGALLAFGTAQHHDPSATHAQGEEERADKEARGRGAVRNAEAADRFALFYPVVCCYSSQLLLLFDRQQQRRMCQQPHSTSSTGSQQHSSSSSGSGSGTEGRSVWQVAEGQLLCAADMLLQPAPQDGQQQLQRQQQVAADLMLTQLQQQCTEPALCHLPTVAHVSGAQALLGVCEESEPSSSGGAASMPLRAPTDLFTCVARAGVLLTQCFSAHTGLMQHVLQPQQSSQSASGQQAETRSAGCGSVHPEAARTLFVRLPEQLVTAARAAMQLCPAHALPLLPSLLYVVVMQIHYLRSLTSQQTIPAGSSSSSRAAMGASAAAAALALDDDGIVDAGGCGVVGGANKLSIYVRLHQLLFWMPAVHPLSHVC